MQDHREKDGPRLMATGHSEDQQNHDGCHRERIGPHENESAVCSVSGVSRRQHQQDERQKLRETDKAQIECVVGQGVDLPPHRDVEHLPADRCAEAGGCVGREVAVAQGYKRIGHE